MHIGSVLRPMKLCTWALANVAEALPLMGWLGAVALPENPPRATSSEIHDDHVKIFFFARNLFFSAQPPFFLARNPFFYAKQRIRKELKKIRFRIQKTVWTFLHRHTNMDQLESGIAVRSTDKDH